MNRDLGRVSVEDGSLTKYPVFVTNYERVGTVCPD